MQDTNLQLTPEQREALLVNPGQPIPIADQETRTVYLLLEQSAPPELEADYIRAGLEVAREQIARSELSTASIDEMIAKASSAQPAPQCYNGSD